jgi:hypothetical protein
MKIDGPLDDGKPAVRESASERLASLGRAVEPELRQALTAGPRAEVGRRLRALLGAVELPIGSPELLRRLRGIEVLERVGGSDAQELLKALAQGPAGALDTEQARAALDRLSKRPGPTP